MIVALRSGLSRSAVGDGAETRIAAQPFIGNEATMFHVKHRCAPWTSVLRD